MDLNFVEEFHGLVGDAVSERKRNLFKLLIHYKPLQNDANFMDILTNNMQPTTFLEHVFYVDTLLYFRHTDGLLKCLIEGYDMAVCKIIKQKWFFAELFSKLAADVFIETIIPKLSFSVRTKVLKRLGQHLNGPLFDNAFEAIVARYGLDRALPYLQYCSSDKIMVVIRSNGALTLTNQQLKVMFCKDPDILFRYFCTYEFHRSGQRSKPKYVNLMRFILSSSMDTFFHLITKFPVLQFKYGRRETKKIFISKPQYLWRNYSPQHRWFNYHVFVRGLTMTEKITLCQLIMPSSYQNEDRVVDELLRFCPKKCRYAIYSQAFAFNHNSTIDRNPGVITEYLLNLHMTAAERDLLAQLTIANGKDAFLAYLDINSSIPSILEKINITSNIEIRQKLLVMLFKTCKINDHNLDVLKQMLEHFLNRHKDECLNTYRAVLREVYDFGVERLDDTAWKCINQAWTHMQINFNCTIGFVERAGYVRFLFEQQPSLIDPIIAESIRPRQDNSIWCIFHDCPPLQRYIIDFMLSNAPQYLSPDYDLPKVDAALLDFILCHNLDIDVLEHARLRALLFTRSIITFKNHKNVWKFIRSQRHSHDDLDTIFWIHPYLMSRHERHMWYLRYFPQQMCTNVDAFAMYLHSSYLERKSSHVYNSALLKYVKLYTHLDLDRRIIDYSLNKLKRPNVLAIKENCFRIIITLMDTFEYIRWCSTDYLPNTNNVLLDDDDDDDDDDSALQDFYRSQSAIARSFRFLSAHYAEAFDVVLQFWDDDFFPAALPSIACILYHLPEQCVAKDALNKMSARQGAFVHDYALHYARELLPSVDVWPFFERYANALIEQPNVSQSSMRMLVFEVVLKYFCKLSTQQAFAYVKTFIEFLDKNDVDNISRLPDMASKLPIDFVAPYVELVWQQFTEPAQLPKLADTDLKARLLRLICDRRITGKCSLIFCEQLITEYFLQKDCLIALDVNTFTFAFLRHHPNAQLDFVFGIVDERITSRELWHHFFHQSMYYIMLLENPHVISANDKRVLSNFIEKLASYFTPVRYFNEYCKLRFARIKCLTTWDRWPQEIAEFWQSMLSSYGPLIIDALVVIAIPCLEWLAIHDTQIDYILFPVLEISQNSPEMCIIIIRLLANKYNLGLSYKFPLIISILRRHSLPALQIQLNMLLARPDLPKI